MNVKELMYRGEITPRLYACGRCGQAFSPRNSVCRDDMGHDYAREAAFNCCTTQYCDCGVELEKYRTSCEPCSLRKRLKRAKVIDAQSYSGAVCASGEGEWGNGYSSDMSAMLEWCEENEEPEPAYCHPCDSQKLLLDAERILENAVSDMHEESHNNIVDADELHSFLDIWNAKQTDIAYYEDQSRVIILDNERFLALIEEPKRKIQNRKDFK